MSHTPGPWIARFNSDSQLWEIGASPELDKGFGGKVSWTLAIVLRGGPNAPKGEAIANAHLMAGALALLEELQNLISLSSPFFTDEVQMLALSEARAAVAKAKGGTDESRT